MSAAVRGQFDRKTGRFYRGFLSSVLPDFSLGAAERALVLSPRAPGSCQQKGSAVAVGGDNGITLAWTALRRRDLLRACAGLPIFGALLTLLVLGDEQADAQGRRKRRKKAHKHDKSPPGAASGAKGGTGRARRRARTSNRPAPRNQKARPATASAVASLTIAERTSIAVPAPVSRRAAPARPAPIASSVRLVPPAVTAPAARRMMPSVMP
jgi:hypothetical protein